MVIGKLASGSKEDSAAPQQVAVPAEVEKKQPNGILKIDPELVEEKPKSIPVERKDSVVPTAVVTVECGDVNGVVEAEDESLDENAKGGGGGGRWGALVKQRKADIIELVRT